MPIHALALLFVLCLFAVPPASAQEVEPRFTENNLLLRPQGYREWIFIGATLGMSYEPSAEKRQHPKFHNLYINPSSYREYRKTGRFPDRTIIAMEVLTAGSRESINQQGHFQDKSLGVEAAVKDTSRFEEGWAYFNFIDEDGSAKDSAEAYPKSVAGHATTSTPLRTTFSRSSIRFSAAGRLSDDFLHDSGRELIRQAFLQPMALEDQVAEVHPQQMKDRCVEIVDAGAVLLRRVTELIRRAVDRSAFRAAAGQPDAEAGRPMIAAGALGVHVLLGQRQAPEFAAPNHERGIQQIPLLQVGQQRRDRLVGLAASVPQAFDEVRMRIPNL